ncbi:MAG: carnitine dehydratase [Actinobacteria bacterium RBG_16_68_21]|nr:MAG: carnitine dehydratase [Actinobacteria bacterium RBG_16_68_21]
MSGPLAGLSVVEIGSIGPGPFAAMVLADLGARVVRIDRSSGGLAMAPMDPLLRGRAASLTLDLKRPEAVEVVLRLVERSDVLIEGYRPGVAERLGIGPEACAARNGRLIYGRITGWGQDGPRAAEAGHDIDYIAVAGALHPMGPAELPPFPPLNLIADFGGGGMLAVVGVLAALVEREASGRGQVVDAAMVDGTALLTTLLHGMAALGLWSEQRENNLLDGAAPFYRCYRTADDRFVAVGALEPKFYAALIVGLGLDDEDLPAQYDRSGWDVLARRFAEVFATGTRDEWAERFAGVDACVTPVLGLTEAPSDPHLAGRGVFVTIDGVVQPAPAPRFSRSAAGQPLPARVPGGDAAAVLGDLGYSATEVQDLLTGAARPV